MTVTTTWKDMIVADCWATHNCCKHLATHDHTVNISLALSLSYTRAFSLILCFCSRHTLNLARSSTSHLSRVLQCVAVCCSMLQSVAVCCSVLQCVAVHCSVLQCVAVHCSAWRHTLTPARSSRSPLGTRFEKILVRPFQWVNARKLCPHIERLSGGECEGYRLVLT